MFYHRSLTEIPEDKLINQLLSRGQALDRLLRIDGIDGIPDDGLIFERVDLCGSPRERQGDIDILICPPGSPERATAIQVKRFKVGPDAFHTGKPNKLQEFEKGAQQANMLADMGFWQVYLFAFVVVDSRAQNAGRISFSGPTPELRAVIDQKISIQPLSGRVGLMTYELVQPMDDAPLRTGTGSISIKRRAEAIRQREALTAWIASVMAARA